MISYSENYVKRKRLHKDQPLQRMRKTTCHGWVKGRSL